MLLILAHLKKKKKRENVEMPWLTKDFFQQMFASPSSLGQGILFTPTAFMLGHATCLGQWNMSMQDVCRILIVFAWLSLHLNSYNQHTITTQATNASLGWIKAWSIRGKPELTSKPETEQQHKAETLTSEKIKSLPWCDNKFGGGLL